MRNLFVYRILFIIIAVISTRLPYSLAVSGNGFISIMDDTQKEIISISTMANDQETTITLQSGKIMTVKNCTAVNSPPRIIYDIPYDGSSFKSIKRTLKGSNVKNIRVGYYSGNIRLVLDINGANIPKFTHHSNSHELIIQVETEKKGDDEKKEKDEGARQNNPIVSNKSLSEKNNHTVFKKVTTDDSLKKNMAQCAQEPEPKDVVSEKKPQYDPAAILQKKLTESEPNDNDKDASLFLSAVNAFKNKQLQEAVNSFKNLVKTHPKGKYSEKSYFLLAKSIEQLYIETPSEHYSIIKESYDDAIYKFPSSIFVPDALLSAGNLCLKTDNYSEALSYYNRIIEKNIDSVSTARASLQKGEALSKKGKYTEAISVYEGIIQNHNAHFLKTEAELGMAKALFEINSFQKSINMLSCLKQESENIYRYPDISLYLGYNYYQTGNYAEARKNLLRYYNIYPNGKVNHLVLSKVGDAYRAEKLYDSASKIYRLVFDQFPRTEGALISLTRLAEQQESGELKNADNLISLKIAGKEMSSPRQIYEKVISEYANKDSKNPMLEYTMLKLAIFYQKEKNYSKSMEILEDLLRNYPSSKLQPEIIYVLTDTFEAVLQDRGKDEDNKMAYTDIINTYLSRKHIIQRFAPPRTLIAVAVAYIRLGLEDMAIELLLQADTALPDKEKPKELLYYLGEYFIGHGQLENGLKRLDLLTVQYQSGEFAAKAYHAKGNIYQKNKKYEQAIEMFSQALKSSPGIEDKIIILCDKAMVLADSGLKNESLEAIKEVENILAANPKQAKSVYQKAGEICLYLGKPEDALSFFNSAIAAKKDDRENIKLKFKIAQCYEALNRKSDYTSIYNQIAKSGDPLWSRLAKERMDAIVFKELLSKKEFDKYRR